MGLMEPELVVDLVSEGRRGAGLLLLLAALDLLLAAVVL